MICYVFARGKQHLGLHVVVGYGIKFFWQGPFHYVSRSPGRIIRIEAGIHALDQGEPYQ